MTEEQRPSTPAEAWAALAAGNARFVSGNHSHPNQDTQRRHVLAGGQRPFALFFGCADSRVAAEIIFDQGLGDLFVVRTAGHVAGSSVLGSLEFGVGVLNIPLIVVLGHDTCGAVAATIRAVNQGEIPPGYIRDVVERIIPSVLEAQRLGLRDTDVIEAQHVRNTIDFMVERSSLLSQRVSSGALGIVGATYHLADGEASIVHVVGDIGEIDATVGPALGRRPA